MGDVFTFKISADYVDIMLSFRAKCTYKIMWPPLCWWHYFGTVYFILYIFFMWTPYHAYITTCAVWDYVLMASLQPYLIRILLFDKIFDKILFDEILFDKMY